MLNNLSFSLLGILALIFLPGACSKRPVSQISQSSITLQFAYKHNGEALNRYWIEIISKQGERRTLRTDKQGKVEVDQSFSHVAGITQDKDQIALSFQQEKTAKLEGKLVHKFLVMPLVKVTGTLNQVPEAAKYSVWVGSGEIISTQDFIRYYRPRRANERKVDLPEQFKQAPMPTQWLEVKVDPSKASFRSSFVSVEGPIIVAVDAGAAGLFAQSFELPSTIKNGSTWDIGNIALRPVSTLQINTPTLNGHTPFETYVYLDHEASNGKRIVGDVVSLQALLGLAPDKAKFFLGLSPLSFTTPGSTEFISLPTSGELGLSMRSVHPGINVKQTIRLIRNQTSQADFSAIQLLGDPKRVSNLTGTLLDHQGQAIANQSLTLITEPYRFHTKTNKQGDFVFRRIPAQREGILILTESKAERDLQRGSHLARSFPLQWNSKQRHFNLNLKAPEELRLGSTQGSERSGANRKAQAAFDLQQISVDPTPCTPTMPPVDPGNYVPYYQFQNCMNPHGTSISMDQSGTFADAQVLELFVCDKDGNNCVGHAGFGFSPKILRNFTTVGTVSLPLGTPAGYYAGIVQYSPFIYAKSPLEPLLDPSSQGYTVSANPTKDPSPISSVTLKVFDSDGDPLSNEEVYFPALWDAPPFSCTSDEYGQVQIYCSNAVEVLGGLPIYIERDNGDVFEGTYGYDDPQAPNKTITIKVGLGSCVGN